MSSAIAQVEAAKGYQPPSPEELKPKLGAWGRVLAEIPDAELTDALNAALGSWDFTGNVPFGPSIIKAKWAELRREQRAHAESEARASRARHQTTYACWHCLDIGYQAVWQHRRFGWYSSLRGCGCSAAPLPVRHNLPLIEPEFVRHPLLSEYVQREELSRFGAPTRHWESVAKEVAAQPAPMPETTTNETLPF